MSDNVRDQLKEWETMKPREMIDLVVETRNLDMGLSSVREVVEGFTNGLLEKDKPDSLEDWSMDESVLEGKMSAVDQKKLMDFLKKGTQLQKEYAEKSKRQLDLQKMKPRSDKESTELSNLQREVPKLGRLVSKWLDQAEKMYPDYDTFISNAKKLGYKEKDLP